MLDYSETADCVYTVLERYIHAYKEARCYRINNDLRDWISGHPSVAATMDLLKIPSISKEFRIFQVATTTRPIRKNVYLLILHFSSMVSESCLYLDIVTHVSFRMIGIFLLLF